MVSEFFMGAMVVGLAQATEGFLLIKERRITTIITAISLIEFSWVITSVYFLFNVFFPQWTLALPAFFISYNLIGWWNSFRLLDGIDDLEDLNHFVVPQGYAYASVSFGLFYFAAALLALLQNQS